MLCVCVCGCACVHARVCVGVLCVCPSVCNLFVFSTQPLSKSVCYVYNPCVVCVSSLVVECSVG